MTVAGMDNGEAPQAAADFRVRSAQRKRERMRARLLEATLTACAARGGRTVIEDILKLAGVSRGTFYAHFDSLHAALSLAGQQLADEAVRALLTMYPAPGDPARRSAAGFQAVLAHAVVDPAWGAVFVQSDDFAGNGVFVSAIRHTLLEGQQSGAYRRSDIEALVDLNVGAMICGARTLQTRKGDRWSYIGDAATSLLLGMGVAEGEAQNAVAWARADLRQRGPHMLPWWREFD